MQGCVEGIEFRCYRLPCYVFCVGWMSIHQRLKGHGMFHVAFSRRHRRRNWRRTLSTVSTHVCLEEEGFLLTRQAHVIGGGRRKRKVVHITESGRTQLHSQRGYSRTTCAILIKIEGTTSRIRTCTWTPFRTWVDSRRS